MTLKNNMHPLWPQALEKSGPHSSLRPLTIARAKFIQEPPHARVSQYVDLPKKPNSFPQKHKEKFLPPSQKPYQISISRKQQMQIGYLTTV